jgi:hypothetical protein
MKVWEEAKFLLFGGCDGYHRNQPCFEPGLSPDFKTMCRHVGKMYQGDPRTRDSIFCIKHNAYMRKIDA